MMMNVLEQAYREHRMISAIVDHATGARGKSVRTSFYERNTSMLNIENAKTLGVECGCVAIKTCAFTYDLAKGEDENFEILVAAADAFEESSRINLNWDVLQLSESVIGNESMTRQVWAQYQCGVSLGIVEHAGSKLRMAKYMAEIRRGSVTAEE